ncbi:MAG: hypothetical protein U5L03_16610 [Burkholderiaceae bacterium]|nr:hypothetical protein [Burkholderiaceae bacterium]
MNVKRIVAKTSREAMRQLREALGPDAVILSNRAVEGGVEVLAMPAEDIAAMAPPVDGNAAAGCRLAPPDPGRPEPQAGAAGRARTGGHLQAPSDRAHRRAEPG